MNPRELVILLLGLAIVAVVLRGLYVALQARRGQIRLAIDKNIPKNVDLEALEMAELPSGGARVVRRGAAAPVSSEGVQASNAALTRANARAAELDLGADDGEAVPVLMDAVQINERESSNQSGEETEVDDSAYDYDSSVDEAEVYGADEAPLPENDYENTAGDEPEELAAVAPDYYGDAEEPQDEDADDADPGSNAELDAEHDDFDAEHEEQGFDEEQEEDYATQDEFDEEEQGYDDDDVMADEESGDRAEPSLGSFDDDLDDFSMSAGERIGFEHKADKKSGSVSVSKSDAGDERDGDSPDEAESSGGGLGSSIRSVFNRWGKSAAEKRSRKAERKAEKAALAAREAEARAEAAAVESAELEDDEPLQDTLLDYSVADDVETPRAEPRQEMEPQQLDIEPAFDYERESVSADEQADVNPAGRAAHEGQPAEVLVVNVMAKEGYAFAGDDLMHALITSGLKFGDMNIFHQRLGNQPKGPVIFSVANILNPGSFDLNAMDSFTTVGVSMFLALPSPINNLDAFEKMLVVAKQLCETLGGELRDDSRNLMTAQTIEHYRQRVRDFELRQLKAAGGRG